MLIRIVVRDHRVQAGTDSRQDHCFLSGAGGLQVHSAVFVRCQTFSFRGEVYGLWGGGRGRLHSIRFFLSTYKAHLWQGEKKEQ